MLEPRSAFGVCWHLNLVYLCGGTHPSIETFDPRTLTFSRVCELEERISDITAFSHLGGLYFLEDPVLRRGASGEWHKTARQPRAELESWWEVPYFVSVAGNLCHFLSGQQCVSLDLRTLLGTSYLFAIQLFLLKDKVDILRIASLASVHCAVTQKCII